MIMGRRSLLLCFIFSPFFISLFSFLFTIQPASSSTSVRHHQHNRYDCANQNNLSHWMTCATPDVLGRPLLSLAMPGSHDSFAYWLDTNPELDLAPDMPKWQLNLLSLWSLVRGRHHVRSMLKNWSRTQSLDIVEQLNAGVRYFDIRIAYDASHSKQLRFVHMLWGKPVYGEIDKMNAFLEQNPREIVILDFNHFYQMTNEHHQQLATFLQEKFGSKIVSFRRWASLNWLTLKRLQSAKLQVIIVYHAGYGVYASDSQFWPEGAAISPWPDTDQLNDLLAFLNQQYKNRTEPYHSFFVYQGVLTPSALLIAGRYGSGSLRGDLANVATPAFVKWLTRMAGFSSSSSSSIGNKNKKQHLLVMVDDTNSTTTTSDLPAHTTNKRLKKRHHHHHHHRNNSQQIKLAICIADFVEVANFTQNVIQLNY